MAQDATEPTYTKHREHPRHGGATYWRCETCGAENVASMGGRRTLMHKTDCPHAEDRR